MSTLICKTCDELVDACKRSAWGHLHFLRASKEKLHGWRGSAKRTGMLCWDTCVRNTRRSSVG